MICWLIDNIFLNAQIIQYVQLDEFAGEQPDCCRWWQ